ncbi:MAG: hypothetical protein Q8Q40_05385 [Methylococcaceae bacterium]|nr:hypothetical protein [Methylococcaceae bacterium]MDP3903387.1 hypothetical protein [Methylococcaceae bacterium]
MKYQKTLLVLALIASTVTTSTAQASLFDRGGGLLYDNVLNVTWLQDANYAHTSGYALADSTGRMDWATATNWAANLNFDGLTGWRLATNTPVSGGTSFDLYFSYNGSTDFSYNITSPHSELAYMYNVNLGLTNAASTTGASQSNFGIFGNGTTTGQNNVGLVNNLQGTGYWSGAELSPGSGTAWYFNTSFGSQGHVFPKGFQFYAWAVRPGDVAAIPVPSAVWLFGTGIIGLLGLGRLGNIGSLGQSNA